MKIKINGKTRQVDKREYDRDAVTVRHTAFTTFAELVAAKGGYRPSIYLGDKTPKAQRELLFLAFEYNRWMAANHDGRRVYKGDWAPVFPKEHPILSETVFQCAVPGCEEPGVDIAPISINNGPKKTEGLCRCHYEAAQEDCDHKFVDSKCCLKCGWVPQEVAHA